MEPALFAFQVVRKVKPNSIGATRGRSHILWYKRRSFSRYGSYTTAIRHFSIIAVCSQTKTIRLTLLLWIYWRYQKHDCNLACGSRRQCMKHRPIFECGVNQPLPRKRRNDAALNIVQCRVLAAYGRLARVVLLMEIVKELSVFNTLVTTAKYHNEVLRVWSAKSFTEAPRSALIVIFMISLPPSRRHWCSSKTSLWEIPTIALQRKLTAPHQKIRRSQ